MKYLLILLIMIPSVTALGGISSSENYETYTQLSGGGTNTTSENYDNDLLIGEIAGNTTSENYETCLGFFCISALAPVTEEIIKGLKTIFPLILLLMMLFIATQGKNGRT